MAIAARITKTTFHFLPIFSRLEVSDTQAASIRSGALPFHQVLHFAIWGHSAGQHLTLLPTHQPSSRAKVVADGGLKVGKRWLIVTYALKGVAADGIFRRIWATILRRTARVNSQGLLRALLGVYCQVSFGREFALPAAHVPSAGRQWYYWLWLWIPQIKLHIE